MTGPARTDPEPTLVTVLGRLLPEGLDRCVHVIAGAGTLECRDDRWRSVLAVVEHGCVELVTARGARLRLAEGAVFSLSRLGPVVIRNLGTRSAVVATVGRHCDEGSGT